MIYLRVSIKYASSLNALRQQIFTEVALYYSWYT